MLEKDVIRPSKSPWACPVVLVKKKNGDIRLCVDYRKLNEVTKKDSYPLPLIEETLESLSGSKWFSTLDLASGYWQVELHPDDRFKSAFTLHSGLYEFQTMPFGLTNAPATFQRLMQTILGDLEPKACLVYLDDIIVHGKTTEEQPNNLRLVFTRLRKVGLKLKPTKCKFLEQQVAYLGHLVTADGICCDPEKIEKVRSWPTPKNVDEIRSFLGLASYYRRFIRNFAEIASPLNAMLGKDVPFKWTQETQNAMDELRKALCSPPVLKYPDTSPNAGIFILDTDASETAIGAVLSQRNPDDSENVIAYSSRGLCRREKNYCTTRKEMLALISSIRRFRQYLLEQKCSYQIYQIDKSED